MDMSRSAFYRHIIQVSGDDLENLFKNAREQFEKWFVVDVKTGQIWLVSMEEADKKFWKKRGGDQRILTVGCYSDVNAPLYDKEGKYLGMCPWGFKIRDWFAGGPIGDPLPPVSHLSSVVDMTGYTEVRIVPDE
jgi:hypothetical protein